MGNDYDGFISKLDMAERILSEMKHLSTEKTKKHRKQRQKGKSNYQELQYTSKSVTGALMKYQEKKERNEQMKYLEQK